MPNETLFTPKSYKTDPIKKKNNQKPENKPTHQKDLPPTEKS